MATQKPLSSASSSRYLELDEAHSLVTVYSKSSDGSSKITASVSPREKDRKMKADDEETGCENEAG